MKITLDWNCVIEVEEQRDQSSHVVQLLELHEQGIIEVALLAVSASENSKSKRFPGSAALFQERVQKLGWSHLPIVPMPDIWGLSYWDFAYWVSDGAQFEREFSAIWDVIARNVARDFRDHITAENDAMDNVLQSESLAKWRNAWCDVMSAYCHIHERRDVFVTLNTRDFQKHIKSLAKLGMAQIFEPRELVECLGKK